MKESALVSYRAVFQRLIKYFLSVQFERFPQSHDKHADVLMTLDSKADICDEAVVVNVIDKTLRAIAVDSLL